MESKPCHGNEPLGLGAAITPNPSVNHPGNMPYDHKESHPDIVVRLSAKFIDPSSMLPRLVFVAIPGVFPLQVYDLLR